MPGSRRGDGAGPANHKRAGNFETGKVKPVNLPAIQLSGLAKRAFGTREPVAFLALVRRDVSESLEVAFLALLFLTLQFAKRFHALPH